MRDARVLGAWCAAAAFALGVSAVAVAGGASKGVPDAPPIEKILARHDGFVFPRGFETRDGRSLPEGTYDLVLIESGSRYYIQLINRDTQKGIRVAAEATGELVQEMLDPVPSVSIRSEKGGDRFLFHVGSFTASIPLREVRKAG